jgi:thiol-disulfide isomerase/thioredoxin
MKKLCLPLLLCFYLLPALSQTCRLSGTIKGNGHDPLNLVLLYGDGHYSIPTVQLPLSADQSFSQTIILKHPLFAMVKCGDWEQRILLSPSRDLQLQVQLGDTPTIRYNGTAAEENKLIQRCILDTIPFFMKGKQEDNRYAKLAAGDWRDEIMKPVKQQIRTASAQIDVSSIPANLKTLLISETKYVYQCHLHDLTNNNLSWAKNPDRDSLLDVVMHWLPKPDSVDLISGFYANMIMQKQIHYRLNKTAREAKGDKRYKQKVISDFFQLPYAVVDSLIREYGERYMTGWLYARVYLPSSMQDKLLFNKILDAANDASFKTSFLLLDTLQFYYPNSPYLPVARAEVQQIKEKLVANTNNNRIMFRQPGSIHSLAELVKPYAGKIVYLDIWGTWCGPCRIEMGYVAELKKRYQGKDIVFVYLDMDDNAKEKTWKDYLRYFQIEGEHYRMTREEIAPIWSEIKAAGGNDALYPSYVLFDKQGKIISADAERPSSKENLYIQLDKVL